MLKTITLHLIWLLILITAISCNNPKQQHESPNKNQKTKINISTNSLPPNYNGIDVKLIFNVLSKFTEIQKKDEFETTKEFQERVIKLKEEARKIKIFNDLTIDSLLTINVQLVSDLSYNADSAILKLPIIFYDTRKLPLEYNFNDSIKVKKFNSKAIWIYTEGVKETTNVYGKRETYGRIKYAASVMIDNYKKLTDENSIYPLFLQINRDEAKQQRDSIRVAITVKLKAPWYAFELYNSYDTDRAENFTFKEDYMIADLVCLWVYNINTGKVYKKILVND